MISSIFLTYVQMHNDDISVSFLHGYFLLVSRAWMGRRSAVPNCGSKGQCHEILDYTFFFETPNPESLIIPLAPF